MEVRLLNPLQALVQICSSLHHESGKVAVEGFYDDVIEPQHWERAGVRKTSD